LLIWSTLLVLEISGHFTVYHAFWKGNVIVNYAYVACSGGC